MVNSTGFVLIPNAISLELVKKGTDAIFSYAKRQKAKSDKFTEYKAFPVNEEIQTAFMKNENNKSLIATLVEPNPAPSTVKFSGIGSFNITTTDNNIKTGPKDEVYVAIALNNLDTGNGWFIFLEGSHQRITSSSPADWPQRSLKIAAGDAVAWRGDLKYHHTPGGGGMFVTLQLV